MTSRAILILTTCLSTIFVWHASAQAVSSRSEVPVANTLEQLDEQIRNWQADYEKLTGRGLSSEVIVAVLQLNLDRTDVVVKGMRKFKTTWTDDLSENERESKYPAVRYLFEKQFSGELLYEDGSLWRNSLHSPQRIGFGATPPAQLKKLSSDSDPMEGIRAFIGNSLSKSKQKALYAALSSTIQKFATTIGLTVENSDLDPATWFASEYFPPPPVMIQDHNAAVAKLDKYFAF